MPRLVGLGERTHEPFWTTLYSPEVYLRQLADAIAPLAACCPHDDCHEHRVRFPGTPEDGLRCFND